MMARGDKLELLWVLVVWAFVEGMNVLLGSLPLEQIYY